MLGRISAYSRWKVSGSFFRLIFPVVSEGLSGEVFFSAGGEQGGEQGGEATPYASAYARHPHVASAMPERAECRYHAVRFLAANENVGGMAVAGNARGSQRLGKRAPPTTLGQTQKTILGLRKNVVIASRRKRSVCNSCKIRGGGGSVGRGTQGDSG